MLRSGDVVLAQIQFADTYEVKKRPAVILFEEMGNVVVAGVTSNPNMQGIPLTQKEGAIKDSVIKLNYMFTISETMIHKILFRLSKEKKQEIYDQMNKKLNQLND